MNIKSFVTAIVLLSICVGANAQASKSKTRTRKAQTSIRRSSAKSVSSTRQNKSTNLSCPDNRHPHAIDLGLPSGTKWACCNVGASKPEGYGGYYTWGETSTKRSYTEGNYLNGNGKYFYVGKNIAGTDYDAAPANWSSSWVMPSLEQMKELKVKCKCVWTTKNGVNGQKFTGPNGASIFLPAAGIRRNEDLDYAGSEGFYWSSTLNESHTNCAWYLYFYSWVVDTAYDGRFDGRSVRPVRKN